MNKKGYVAIGLAVVLIGGTLGTLGVTLPKRSLKKPVVTQTQQRMPLTLQQKEHAIPSNRVNIYSSIPVVDPQGRTSTLSVKTVPVVFVSDFDPSSIKQLGGEKFKKPPVLIAIMGKPDETPQQEAANVSRDAQGLDVVGVYALRSSYWTQWATGVPDTYLWRDKKVIEIPGPLAGTTEKWTDIFR